MTKTSKEPAAPAVAVAAADPPPEQKLGFLESIREIVVDELWGYRDLIYQLTLRDIRIRYKQAVMGFAWAIFMPMLIVISGVLVRYAMAYLGGGEVEVVHIAGMAVKALPWAFFVGSIGFATNSLIGNSPLVTKIYFPREALPLSATLAQTFDSTVSVLALALVLPFVGVAYGVTLVWVPLLVLMLFTFTVGVAFILSCGNLFFRDVKYIVQVLLTFGIFFTPVFFEPEMFGPTGAGLMMLNPLSPMLEGFRLCVVQGHDLAQALTLTGTRGESILAWSPWYLLYGGAWSVATLVGGGLLFHRLEFVFAEYA